MGGWGSGRPEDIGRKPTTAAARSVDVLTWHRSGQLTAGRVIEWGHLWGEERLGPALLKEPCLRIEVIQEEGLERLDGLVVRYPRHASKDHPADVIALDWTACPYGGARPWFLCPGCEGRARKLFLDFAGGGPKMRCRRCLGLAYESQRQDFSRRLAETAKRGRRKVGGWLSSGLLTPFPDRPKGMHRATYERLASEAIQAELDWLALETAAIGKVSEVLRRRHPSPPDKM